MAYTVSKLSQGFLRSSPHVLNILAAIFREWYYIFIAQELI